MRLTASALPCARPAPAILCCASIMYAEHSPESQGPTGALGRRMKHTYSRAIRLAEQGRVDLRGLVSHRFPPKRVAEAFRLNTAYQDKVVKVMIAN